LPIRIPEATDAVAVNKLAATAQQLRKTVLDMAYAAGSGHLGGSLSCAEILTVLYDAVLDVRPLDPHFPGRDRFILSKGHAVPALYATLARKGFFDESLLMTLRQLSSPLQGHPPMDVDMGLEMSAGSLGMGLSVAVGMALAARQKGKKQHFFVLCGDGELQEGQNWEALNAVAKWGLSEVILIVDRNRVQLDGTVDAVMPDGDLAAKLQAFGMDVIACDGHCCGALLAAFSQAVKGAAPTAIIAETVKGKGVTFMEGQSAWHGQPLDAKTHAAAVREIQAAPDRQNGTIFGTVPKIVPSEVHDG